LRSSGRHGHHGIDTVPTVASNNHRKAAFIVMVVAAVVGESFACAVIEVLAYLVATTREVATNNPTSADRT